MRHTSTKTAALHRAVADDRREAREAHPRCMICECSPEDHDPELPFNQSQIVIHEIANGKCRRLALPHRYCWLALCVYCNAHVVTNKKDWPPVRQLALQKWREPSWHNLQAYVSLIHPHAPNAITEQEVEDEMAELISELGHQSL